MTLHNPDQVLLGSIGSSDQVSTQHDADPASFPAGKAVRNNAGALSLSTGSLIGISRGASLSDTKKTSVCRVGDYVPLLLTDEGEFAELVSAEDLTFTAKEKGEAGNAITIALVDGGTAGDEEVTVDGTDIVVSMDSTVSTATQIKAALDASEEAMALIGVTISGTAGDAQTAFAEDALEGGLDSYPYAVPGQPVEVSATTGLAVSDDVLTGATYLTGALDGINPDDGSVTGKVAVIDMGGGL